MESPLAKLHNAGVVHGALTTSNMMMMMNEPKNLLFIEFGLAPVVSNPEELADDLYVLERALLSGRKQVPGSSATNLQE
jgi:TP53 regulating kinase-like protein